ncbi:universal stress protein [Rhodococcus zopfii]|uniref:universal stress protein n=1 Tax=Rhodococcus zopfii TaxID=43772 RepID=UPI0009352511|nr:universal stress protein [Rhodococcus zopfii]
MDVATDPGHASGSDDVSQARVVVGVDGSDSSIDALRWAARLAPSLGATIDATIAWHPAHTYGFYPYPADYRPDQEAAEMLSDAIAGAFDGVPPAGIVESVREGHPSQVLIDAARHAQMLVLGSRGHGGFSGLLLGSVSAYCAEHAPCPVLVVRAEAGTSEQ